MHGKVLGMRETPNGKTVPKGVRFWEENFRYLQETARFHNVPFSVAVNQIVARYYGNVARKKRAK